MRRHTIGVIGNASRPGQDLPRRTAELAFAVGKEVARAGHVLVTGGTGGVMAHSSAGAKDAGGLTIGFLPQPDFSQMNPHVDVAFPTGMGTMRNYLTARACDAVIVVGGGVGTLNEITIAYDAGIPIVAVAGSGGWSDRLPSVLIDGEWMDERKATAIEFATDPAEAVQRAAARITDTRRAGLSAFIGAAGE